MKNNYNKGMVHVLMIIIGLLIVAVIIGLFTQNH